MKNIILTPTWTFAMSIYIAALQNGTGQGKIAARQALMALAARLDEENQTSPEPTTQMERE